MADHDRSTIPAVAAGTAGPPGLGDASDCIGVLGRALAWCDANDAGFAAIHIDQAMQILRTGDPAGDPARRVPDRPSPEPGQQPA